MYSQLPSRLLEFIIYFIRPNTYLMLVLYGCAALSGLYGTINSYLIKLVIDIANTNYSKQSLAFHVILLPAILLVINHEVHNLLWRGVQYMNMKIAPKIKNQIINQMFIYVNKHSLRFFQDNFAGAIASNINRIAEHIEIIINESLPFVIRGMVQLIFALITTYFVNPLFSITLFTWTIIFSSLSIIFSSKVKLLSDMHAESQSMLAGKLTDSINNIFSIRLFAKETFEVNYLNYYLKEVANKYCNQRWFLIKFWFVQGISITIMIGIMLFILILLRTNNQVTIGDFAFILGLTIYVADNVWGLTEQIDKINNSIGQCNQTLKMIVIPFEITDKNEAKNLKITSGKITLQNIEFSYNKKDYIFSGTSVIIPGGQKIGLVGSSGSGKTTFINLIVRLFDISSGIITIDNQNIADVTQQSLHENVGFIPQDPVLFHRTLIENIRYSKINADDFEVIEAARLAHAHEFIIRMPDGYSSLVGERGIKLSGGQRQRIAIARAILKNAPILIMDEATSALDSLTESYIQESLTNLMVGKTVIVIAHRLSTLLKMDRILVFDKGKIVEDGKHEELIEINGLYKTLWDAQIGGFLPYIKESELDI